MTKFRDDLSNLLICPISQDLLESPAILWGKHVFSHTSIITYCNTKLEELAQTCPWQEEIWINHPLTRVPILKEEIFFFFLHHEKTLSLTIHEPINYIIKVFNYCNNYLPEISDNDLKIIFSSLVSLLASDIKKIMKDNDLTTVDFLLQSIVDFLGCNKDFEFCMKDNNSKEELYKNLNKFFITPLNNYLKIKQESTLLHVAIELRDIEMVKLLIKAKINVNLAVKDIITPLAWAMFLGYKEIVDLLIEANANLDMAVSLGLQDIDFLNTAVFLIKKGANVNVRNNNGETALMLAAYTGDMELTVDLLNIKNIDVNAKNKYGHTALFFAFKNNYFEIFSLLTKAANKLESKYINWLETMKTEKKQGCCPPPNSFLNNRGITIVKRKDLIKPLFY